MGKRVAYLGPAGTYSEQAAREWSEKATLVPVESIPAVANAVSSGRADEGIVPIENSIEGGVTFTLDLLIHDSELSICGEVIVPIHQCLMAHNKIALSDIKNVISHPQSLGQCRDFLASKLPGAELTASLSNSSAVQEMMSASLETAAISSGRAAALYGATVLLENVEDRSNNETRFVVLSHSDHELTGNDKTSLCFEYGDNAPGILSASLREFASRDINLTKIESRPNKKSLGRYVFLVDVEGHRTESLVAESLDALDNQVSMIKILGSYPSFQSKE
tara:strand:- start:96 stop:929 length:834 start_codon:yes stop_codon:yes gene_type:complete